MGKGALRETLAEEGVRLILQGLRLNPSLIVDLRKRVEAERLEAERSRRRVLTAILAFALATLAAGGYWLYRSQSERMRAEAGTQAQRIAQLQAQVDAQKAAAQAQAQAETPKTAKALRTQQASRVQAQAEAQTKVHTREKIRRNSTGIEWIRIPGGSFMMGTNDSNNAFSDAKPVHEVTIRPFEMSKTLVTNKQYQACMAAGACTANSDQGAIFDGDDHPVVGVDWNQARAFAKWAGGRLPSEAEWEYAARSAGKDYKYPWGNSDANCGNVVIRNCGWRATAPVCSNPSGNTEQGLCDMAGNAWEWVEDWYHNSYNGAPSDGSAWVDPTGSYRVFRGGSWYGDASNVRVALRDYYDPGNRDYYLGFRVAR